MKIKFLFFKRRGSIISAFIAWYIICSFVGGYFSGSIYAKNKGIRWIKNAFLTTLIFPTTLLLLTIVTNISTHLHSALSYTPFVTIVSF